MAEPQAGTTVKSTSPRRSRAGPGNPRWSCSSPPWRWPSSAPPRRPGSPSTWTRTQLGQAVSSQDGLQVQGSKAATTVTALALVALAGGLAASIAGRIARWIITAIILLAAAGIVSAAAIVLADPLAAAQGSIAAATGITRQQRPGGRHRVPGPRRRRRFPAGPQRAADHPGGTLLEVPHQI